MRRSGLMMVAASVLLTGCAPASPVPSPTSDPTPASADLTATTIPTGTLFAPAELGTDERQEWLERLARVATILETTDLGALDADWDGRLTLELPADAAGYAALAGSGGQQSAAVTRCSDGASRITLNPRVGSLEAGYLDTLLLHEAVHAATGSACTDRPLWIEEGLAEWLAIQHDPTARGANQEWLDHHLVTSGVPTGMPADRQFEGTAAQLSEAYALATFAVTTTIEHLGTDAAMAYFAEPDAETTGRIAAWYLAALRAQYEPEADSGG